MGQIRYTTLSNSASYMCIMKGGSYGRVLDLIIVVIVTSIAAHVFNVFISFGYFKQVLGHSPGPCRPINVNGSEDVQISSEGLALFSSGLRYTVHLRTDPIIHQRIGNIYLLDLNEPDPQPMLVPLKMFNRTDFNPHGISIHEDQSTGHITFFVVNHKQNEQAIEIFDFDKRCKCLNHRRSVVDSNIYSPNDILAIGPESFYVTNDHYFHFNRPFLRMLEAAILNLFLRSDVVLFDGSKSRVVANGLIGPNGINMDRSKRHILVSAGFSNAIYIYKRHEDDSLSLAQEINIGTHADNINLDTDTGAFWIAGVPKGLDFVEYTKNLQHPAPSQVVKLRLNNERPGPIPFPNYELREVYLNDGSEHRGSTSAAHFKSKLLIGGIFDKMLMCEVRAY